MSVKQLAEEIINGKRLSIEEDLSFFEQCDLEDLCEGADLIRKHFSGDDINMCTIINARSGRCSEDCKYCAQSAHYKTKCETYEFLDKDRIVSEAISNESEGVDRFSLVTAGRSLCGEEFDKAIEVYKELSEKSKLGLCASMGFLKPEQFRRLKEAGVSRYHANIETSEKYFSNICTTHTFEDKINVIKAAKAEGFSVCSGGIIGMGESFRDRIDMAFTLRELSVDSIPINVLTPIKGTPLENQEILMEEEILRTVAMFRYIYPEADIRLAAGRNRISGNGTKAFLSGANAVITGNMLTTTGSTIKSDLEMFKRMNRK